MSASVFGLGVVLAVVTAVRSIWSPCGLSMLSTITPLGEAGRGHDFRSTSTWFVVGSVMGGVTLGLLMAGLARIADGLGATPDLVWGIITAAALTTAASDGRVGGFHLPGHDRQVNERWLDQYRPWVYGAGFGWQIGVGLGTYIMTAGVYLLILVGGLTADPLLAVFLGALFGLSRGLAVFLASGFDSTEKVLAFHERFERMREPVRRATIVTQALVAVAASAIGGALLLVLAAVLVAAGATVATGFRGPREAVYLKATV